MLELVWGSKFGVYVKYCPQPVMLDVRDLMKGFIETLEIYFPTVTKWGSIQGVGFRCWGLGLGRECIDLFVTPHTIPKNKCSSP